MKRILNLALMVSIITLSFGQQPKLAVVSFDALGANLKTDQLTELLRIEISRHNKYQVVDRYEIQEALSAADIDFKNCFSISCLKQAGKTLDIKYAVSGSADLLGEALFVRIRLVDIQTGSLEKEVVKEFLNIPEKINTMISICVNELVDLPNDKLIVQSLSNRESYESAVNNPYYQTLSLAGPRMGYTFFTGDMAETLKMPKNEGGYDAYAAFFQMGYQFEKQYLNEGKWQALFEFLPMVSGLDQGMFVPSFTIMNGIRNNKNGLEFAIGPSINISREQTAYFIGNEWIRSEDLPSNHAYRLSDYEQKDVMDSRGNITGKTYVVIAAGYSLKSGKLNIPINAFVIPSKESMRYGFSFGFNVRK